MRYCPNCRRWNNGRPQFCHYCGCTWHVRLCPRGHDNPPDTIYCGTCGSAELTDTAGPRTHYWVWLIRLAVISILLLFVITITRSRFHLSQQFIAYIIAIVLLFIGLNLVISILPNPIRRPVSAGINKLKGIGRQIIGWIWEKFKLIFA
jgi:hypothetical protein